MSASARTKKPAGLRVIKTPRYKRGVRLFTKSEIPARSNRKKKAKMPTIPTAGPTVVAMISISILLY